MTENPIKLTFIIVLLITAACNSAQKQNVKPSSDTLAVCGPRALSAVITYYRLDVSWDSLAKISHTSAKGTSMLDLVNTAKTLGFDAVGLKVDYDGLQKLPVPSIAFVNNNHYATVLWAGTDSVLVDDGGVKNFVKRDEFLRQWGGVVLALYPTRELMQRVYGKKVRGAQNSSK